MERVEFGRYIVSDPGICHGQLTFKGTRVLVRLVLQLVARGIDWDQIVWECHDSICREAIGEAVLMASEALVQQHVPLEMAA